MTQVIEIREHVSKVLGGARTYVGEDLRDISYPAVDLQQLAAVTQSPSPDATRSTDASLMPQQPQQDQQTTQGHVTWDWINDVPERSPFEMTIEEIKGLADFLTKND